MVWMAAKIRGYLNEKSEREVFWIVGRDGNEGKTFFQKIYMMSLEVKSVFNGTQ